MGGLNKERSAVCPTRVRGTTLRQTLVFMGLALALVGVLQPVTHFPPTIPVQALPVAPVSSPEPVEPPKLVEVKSTEQIIWEFFISHGFTREQTAGVIGNMWVESSLISDRHQIGGSAYGIVQWEGGRRVRLESMAIERGVYVGDLSFQLDFIIRELNTTEIKAFQTLQASVTVEQATLAFQNYYERCGKCHQDRRIQMAREVLTRY